MTDELKTAIYIYLTDDVELLGYVSDRVYFGEAEPDGNNTSVELPYIVFNEVTSTSEKSSQTLFINTLVQFTIHDDSPTSDNALAILKRLNELIDACRNDMIISNFKILSSKQTFSKVFPKDSDTGEWNAVNQYLIFQQER